MPVFGNPGIALQHAALDVDGAARRVENAAELDHEAVAHHLEDATAMLGNGGIEELAAMLAQRPHGALFIGLHQPAVAHYVGRQYRRQPPLDLLLCHACPLNLLGTLLLALATISERHRRSQRKGRVGLFPSVERSP